jgi:hypothetical protein
MPSSPSGRLLLTTWCCTLQRLAGWSGPPLHRVLPTARWTTTTRALATATAAGGASERAAPHAPEIELSGPGTRETIFAVSSGSGVRCGVTVIRISGPSARLAMQHMTKRGRRDPTLGWLAPRVATLTDLFAPTAAPAMRGAGKCDASASAGEGEALAGSATARGSPAVEPARPSTQPHPEWLDSALVLWFPAPRSFTGEDVLELHVHGGRATVAAVLGALGMLPDHRMAERGEYTRRAFANGRMDLTEVEGLSDLLAANTDAQRRQALAQVGGAARARFDGWRAELLDCLAHTEAVIDFGEDADDLGSDVLAAVSPRVQALARQMRGALAGGRRGELLRDGPRVVIVGPPNAGKVCGASPLPLGLLLACCAQGWGARARGGPGAVPCRGLQRLKPHRACLPLRCLSRLAFLARLLGLVSAPRVWHAR